MRRYRILIPLLLIAFFLRVWQLPQTPPGLWYDEAYYAMDAAWLLDGGPWQLFFAGNNGREPLFIYLQALFIWVFGATPLTSRLIGPLAGTLIIALMAVLALRLCRDLPEKSVERSKSLASFSKPWSAWVPYLATAGLATSFWHVSLSRGGYRGILLPLLAILTFYAFWRGWREGSLKWTVVAGIALGLSQYTYLAARALPLVFVAFVVGWTLLSRLGGQVVTAASSATRDEQQRSMAGLKKLWSTFLLMAALSLAIFAPLGWFFYHHPTLFSARTGDVTFTPDTPVELLDHLFQAVRLFIDNGDPNWRHHLPGRPMLGWLGWLGFWPGLVICLKRFRRPVYFFLLTALVVLYLPALLADPPVHALRLATLLPVYYLIFALGLTGLAQAVERGILVPKLPFGNQYALHRALALALILVILLEAALTTFDYFGRWARAEETYVEYNTPLVDFVDHVIDLTQSGPVIIPLQIYVHPTTRYLLHDQFTEQPAPASLSGPVQLVTLPDNFRLLNVANIPELPAYAWLARDPQGQGVVYVSRPPRLEEQQYLRSQALRVEPEIYRDRFGRELAYFRRLPEPAPLLPLFTQPAPLKEVNLRWGDLAQLTGYEVTPEVAKPGQPITLNLYWRSLTDLTFEHRLFLQVLDREGKPVNQWEGEAFREDMYRWRPEGILPTQHTLWLGPKTPAGPYLIRLGFFEEETGARLPLYLPPSPAEPSAEGGAELPGGQTQLGLFYVSPDGSDPRIPGTPLSANFSEAIELVGVTVEQGSRGAGEQGSKGAEGQGSRGAGEQGSKPVTGEIQNLKSKIENPLVVQFHWRVIRPTETPYTVFLQLLNEQGEVVSSWDSQPFNGLYPTDLWSPGEIIVDQFRLPLPEGGLSPGSYRLITGFYDHETGLRLPVLAGGDFVEISRIVP